MTSHTELVFSVPEDDYLSIKDIDPMLRPQQWGKRAAHAPGGGQVGARRRRSGGRVERRGRRDGDAYEVRAAVGHCAARHRALTAHGASIVAVQEWVGSSTRASPSFRSNVHMTHSGALTEGGDGMGMRMRCGRL